MTNILIIGASRGLGLEFARQYRADSAAVWATARSEAGLQRLHALGARAIALDVTQDEAGSALGTAIGAQRFDVAVLCAGVGDPLNAPDAPTKQRFDAVLQANVLGPMGLLAPMARALVPGGKLAVLSSRMGSIGERTDSSRWLYRASKAALNSVLKDVALAFGDRIACASLHPGWVRTDMGGPGADLAVADSVADLRRVIERLSPADSGCFLDHGGQAIPW
jgi:NAD(P)-dependent dehydrogenase (short-subunit alcohol dehydrogenase family)